MKKFILYLYSTILFSSIVCAQDKAVIKIIVECVSLPANSQIYIAGNDPLLGNWKPDSSPLSRLSNTKWTGSYLFTTGKKLEFKITRGSWFEEALNDDRTIPGNYNLIIERDTTIFIRIKYWADQFNEKVIGQITGITKYHLNFQAEELESRHIVVWLPPWYFLNQEKRYPVLYMHDGQNLFNPVTSLFGVDWQIDETADSLIRQGLIDELIIVGIQNTVNRTSEYSNNDTGYVYMDFVVNTLKPFIDENYRTLSGRENTAVGGSSMGGLISFMLLWEHADIFSKAACISPALKFKRFDFVTPVQKYTGEKKEILIYIDNGGDSIDTIIQPGIDEMLRELDEKGFVEGEDLYWFKDVEAKHTESSWAKRVWRALIFMFGTEKGKMLL